MEDKLQWRQVELRCRTRPVSFLWWEASGDEPHILCFLWRRPGEAAARGEESKKDKVNAPQLFSSSKNEVEE